MAISNLKLSRRQQHSSLLGLSLDGTRLDGVVLRRSSGALQVHQSFGATLSLDPLTADPELVGREIRNHLDAAGVRERSCVLGLPLKWALTTHVEVPKLEGADLDSFLQIEAERSFPCDVSTLMVCHSLCSPGGGKQYAMFVGIPRSHLERLGKVFEAAKLRPVSFSLGLPALQPPGAPASPGVMALAIGETNVGLQVASGGGIAALRILEGALELEVGRKRLQADLLAREARITLGQLPVEVRDSVRQVRIFGPRELGQQLADEMEVRLEAMGLKVEFVARYAPGANNLPADAPVSAALSLAAERMTGFRSGFEFMLPKVTKWQQMTARYSSSKLRTAGAVAAALLLLVAGAFGYQQVELVMLRSQQKGMADTVKRLTVINNDLNRYRPWSTTTLPGLSVMRVLAQSFPEDGAVSAKTVEFRELNTVSCSGLTKDLPSLMAVIDRLRTNSPVSDVRQPNIRGNKSPMSFTFEFHWNQSLAK